MSMRTVTFICKVTLFIKRYGINLPHNQHEISYIGRVSYFHPRVAITYQICQSVSEAV